MKNKPNQIPRNETAAFIATDPNSPIDFVITFNKSSNQESMNLFTKVLMPPLSIINDSGNISPHSIQGIVPSPRPKNKKYKKTPKTPTHLGHSTFNVIT